MRKPLAGSLFSNPRQPFRQTALASDYHDARFEFTLEIECSINNRAWGRGCMPATGDGFNLRNFNWTKPVWTKLVSPEQLRLPGLLTRTQSLSLDRELVDKQN